MRPVEFERDHWIQQTQHVAQQVNDVLLFTVWTLQPRVSLCWCLCEGQSCQSSFVQPTWNDVPSNRTPVESCQTTMSRVKTVGWQDHVCQELPNVIFLVFVTVCVLVGVSLCMCVCKCLRVHVCVCVSRKWSRPIRNSPVFFFLYLLHFGAFVHVLVNFDGFLQFVIRLLQPWKLSLPVFRWDFLAL